MGSEVSLRKAKCIKKSEHTDRFEVGEYYLYRINHKHSTRMMHDISGKDMSFGFESLKFKEHFEDIKDSK